MIYEKHRPTTWDEFVGNVPIVKRLQWMLDRAKAAHDSLVLWISGPSGSGKTTLANLCAKHLCIDDASVEDWDGDKMTVERVRELEFSIQTAGFGGNGWRGVIVNECHAITQRSVKALLTLLETRMPQRRLVVFTTTVAMTPDMLGAEGDSLLSRCIPFKLTEPSPEECARRMIQVAEAEGLTPPPVERCVAYARQLNGNIRALINRVARGDFEPSLVA